jgi:cytochrome c
MADRVDTGLVLRPKNYRPYRGNENDLVSFGKNLFSDTGLSTNGMSCNTCHQDHASFQDTFAKPYPHFVQMTHDRAGVEAVHLDEMIQFCMVVPMAAKPLPWDSRELAALTAYTSTLQKSFKPGMAGTNPCAAKNPCAARSANPCAMNPCTAKRKNPCATKNPCAGRNPCGAH